MDENDAVAAARPLLPLALDLAGANICAYGYCLLASDTPQQATGKSSQSLLPRDRRYVWRFDGLHFAFIYLPMHADAMMNDAAINKALILL